MGALDGKVFVVTGVTSGIGAALARRLIDEGARVVGVGRDAARLDAQLALLGPALEPRLIDLASPAARSAGLAQLAAAHGRVDGIVSNAAECVYEAPLQLDPARWRSLIEVNVLAGVELVQALAPRLPAGGGGHVVLLSSVTARFLPNARFSPYAVTKVAVEQLTEALRLELDPRGHRVTQITPGLVDTPIYDKVAGFAATRARIQEQVPAWLSADDVADAILWTLTRPGHVVVADLVLVPRGQARLARRLSVRWLFVRWLFVRWLFVRWLFVRWLFVRWLFVRYAACL